MVKFIEHHKKGEFPPILSPFLQGKWKLSPFQQLQVSQSVQLPQNHSLINLGEENNVEKISKTSMFLTGSLKETNHTW